MLLIVLSELCASGFSMTIRGRHGTVKNITALAIAKPKPSKNDFWTDWTSAPIIWSYVAAGMVPFNLTTCVGSAKISNAGPLASAGRLKTFFTNALLNSVLEIGSEMVAPSSEEKNVRPFATAWSFSSRYV